MTARVDTQAAKERAEAYRNQRYNFPGDSVSEMYQNAVREGRVVADDVLSLVGLLTDAEKALRETTESLQEMRILLVMATEDDPWFADVPKTALFSRVRDVLENAEEVIAAFDAPDGADE